MGTLYSLFIRRVDYMDIEFTPKRIELGNSLWYAMVANKAEPNNALYLKMVNNFSRRLLKACNGSPFLFHKVLSHCSSLLPRDT